MCSLLGDNMMRRNGGDEEKEVNTHQAGKDVDGGVNKEDRKETGHADEGGEAQSKLTSKHLEVNALYDRSA